MKMSMKMNMGTRMGMNVTRNEEEYEDEHGVKMKMNMLKVSIRGAIARAVAICSIWGGPGCKSSENPNEKWTEKGAASQPNLG